MNVRTSFIARLRNGLLDTVRRGRSFRREEGEIHEEGTRLLSYFGLDHAASHSSRSLPYGDQRRLEIVRALATKPRLLLLDEPAAGMNPYEAMQLTDFLRWVHGKFSLTIVLIEHHMQMVMDLCDRIEVLEFGVRIAGGKPDEVKANPRVVEAYLGTEGELP
jgi:branched-chain amino acid transport system ATP-binding protein